MATKKRALTDEQIEHVITYVTNAGKQRRRGQGAKFNDVDFAMGAAAVFFALEIQDRMPALWIYGPLSGIKIFAEDEQATA